MYINYYTFYNTYISDMNQLLDEDLLNQPNISISNDNSNTSISNDNNDNDDSNNDENIIQPITIKKSRKGVLKCVTRNGKDCIVTKRL